MPISSADIPNRRSGRMAARPEITFCCQSSSRFTLAKEDRCADLAGVRSAVNQHRPDFGFQQKSPCLWCQRPSGHSYLASRPVARRGPGHVGGKPAGHVPAAGHHAVRPDPGQLGRLGCGLATQRRPGCRCHGPITGSPRGSAASRPARHRSLVSFLVSFTPVRRRSPASASDASAQVADGGGLR